MCCLLEMAISIYGIYTLITGQMVIGGGRYCYGTPARIAGGIFAATFPLALGTGIVVGVLIFARGQIPRDEMSNTRLLATGSDAMVALLCVGAGLALALVNSEKKRGPKLDLDEGYDEKFIRPRRSQVEADEPYSDDGIKEQHDELPDDRITGWPIRSRWTAAFDLSTLKGA